MESAQGSIVTRMVVIDKHKTAGEWWVQFEGSGEQLCFGEIDPGWEIGEEIEVVFRRKRG